MVKLQANLPAIAYGLRDKKISNKFTYFILLKYIIKIK